ncbi:hypothetical protein ACH4RA_33000 [Streptomyces smyrnaeus]|uniref:hypothetical protein n=1 Tax=Streptomyces TaxID=1883 RepID=UPI000C18C106|nr:hypothetical protein [Streptomyces sp. RK75]MBQ0868197.1 hypothetical protein [Streptomyces sp. RK75]MBQ1161559.1 hypothetical protein [Streptomyces sp. A73]
MPQEPKTPDAPAPEPLRFYGTTWVDHSGGYALRRVALGVGAALAAVAGAFVLRFAYQGVVLADIGSWASVLLVVAFAVCSALAFSRTLTHYGRRPSEREASAESSMHSIRIVGFIGVLLAYALRTCVEAPGEKLHRAEYEAALDRHERQRTARTGNPAARGRGAKGGKGRKKARKG